jgi:hypothetical protein
MSASHYLGGYLQPNSTSIIVSQLPVGGGAAADIPIDTAGTIIFSITYMTE